MEYGLYMESDQKLQLKYDLTNDEYLVFIRELRLQACDKGKLSHGRHILPLDADADPPYIDVYLQESGLDKGFVRIRRYDLRLLNFQDPFGNSLNVDDFQIYDDDSRLVDFGIEGFLLGLPTFIKAVNSLVNFCKKLNHCKTNFDMGTPLFVTCDSKKLAANMEENFNVRTSLTVLCLVLCEATKLDLLSCILGNAFKFGYEVPLSSWLLERIHDWGFFSKELLTGYIHYNKAECDIFLPYEENNWHHGRRLMGVTCQDIARCLGILQAVSPPPEPMEDEYLSGEPLVEIYSVSVYLDGGRSGSVYGTINVIDDGALYNIYNRGPNECESIESHEILSLQDPNGFIIGRGRLYIDFDLLEGGDNSEISKGKASWDNFLYVKHDLRISSLVQGKNGYAIVYYTVFSQAIIAEVEVTLLNKESHPNASDDVCVCGRICARCDYFAYVTDDHERYYQTTLFNKYVGKELSAPPCTSESGTCIRVKLREAIKLSRSRVSVPVGDYLILKADLKSCKGIPVVTGSIKWFAKGAGESEGIMEGHPYDSHLLQVKVKWIESKRQAS